MYPILPLIPVGATPINESVYVFRTETTWTYYVALLPVYSHEADDDAHFRLTIAQLIQSGACRPREIISTFGITKNKVMRAGRQLRERGTRSFFERRRTHSSGPILTVDKLKEAQRLLEEMDHFTDESERLAEQKKRLNHYITWEQLPEDEKFMKLSGSRRRLINTIGMIAYRAETAMASLMCGDDKTLCLSDARTLLQALFLTPADLMPIPDSNTLEVHVHGASTPVSNRRLA